jgi:hypothetical protein
MSMPPALTIWVPNGRVKSPAPFTVSVVYRSPALIVTRGCTVQESWTNRLLSVACVAGGSGPIRARVIRKVLGLSYATVGSAPSPLRTLTSGPPSVGTNRKSCCPSRLASSGSPLGLDSGRPMLVDGPE